MNVFFLLLLVVILSLVLNGPTRGQEPPGNDPGSELSGPETSATPMKRLTRAEIVERLQKLDAYAQSAPKETIPFAAMCYKPMAPRDGPAEYVCPVCHAKKRFSQRSLDGLSGVRRTLKLLPLEAKLDERFYCGKCNANGDLKALFLEVTLTDQEKPVRTEVHPDDLQDLLKVLTASELQDNLFEGRKVPDMANKIHEILGGK